MVGPALRVDGGGVWRRASHTAHPRGKYEIPCVPGCDSCRNCKTICEQLVGNCEVDIRVMAEYLARDVRSGGNDRSGGEMSARSEHAEAKAIGVTSSLVPDMSLHPSTSARPQTIALNGPSIHWQRRPKISEQWSPIPRPRAIQVRPGVLFDDQRKLIQPSKTSTTCRCRLLRHISGLGYRSLRSNRRSRFVDSKPRRDVVVWAPDGSITGPGVGRDRSDWDYGVCCGTFFMICDPFLPSTNVRQRSRQRVRGLRPRLSFARCVLPRSRWSLQRRRGGSNIDSVRRKSPSLARRRFILRGHRPRAANRRLIFSLLVTHDARIRSTAGSQSIMSVAAALRERSANPVGYQLHL